MKKTTRVALLVAVPLVALALASSALASFTPKILISPVPPAGGGVTVSVNVGNNDDPTAKVSIYVPNGYQLAAPASPGTKLGAVTATASAADLGGAVLPLTGDLLVGDKSSAAIVSAAQACGTTTALAVWLLHLTAAGQTLDIPLFVMATAGPELTVGPAKLVVCLPPPDVPAGTPGRAVFGAKLLSATFTTTALTNPATAGDYRWTSLWTPYNPGKGTVNAAGSVEVQSIVHLPTQATVSVKKKKLVRFKYVRINGKRHRVIASVRTLVTVTGTATQGSSPAVGANATLTVNGKPLGSKTTSSAGTASFTFTLLKGTASIALTAAIPDQDLGLSGCVASAIFQGLPCTDGTVGGGTVSATAKVTAYKK
jgi:hypothetical protein